MEIGNYPEQSAEGGQLTGLILEVFKLNGRLLQAGDQLVASLGLTSARWQVLGAISLAGGPQPVANIARNMGLTRQAVQRVVNDLAERGHLVFAPNPHHRRARLVLLSERGVEAFQAATERQLPWANQLASGLSVEALGKALSVARELVKRLDAGIIERDAQGRR